MNAAIATLFFSSCISHVSAAPGLVLDVVGPSSVVDADGLAVKATLKNTGDVALKLLNDPRSILSKANTNTFSISSASGTPKFTGLKVKYVPSQAARATEGSAFTFSASNLFHYVDESGELKSIEATSNSHQFKIAGKLATSSHHASASSISKRAVSFTGCNADQQTQIRTAASASDAMVANANSYLSGLTSGKPRYTTWFGTFDQSRYNTVVSHFKNIGSDATAINYDCTDCLTHPSMDYPNTYAYVDPGVPSKIYLCGAFWNAPTTGTDSKAGTIVHENSHFTVNGAIEDHVYGQGEAQALAKSNPAFAVMNADSHEYFAENTPALS